MQPYLDAGWQIDTRRPIGKDDRVTIWVKKPNQAEFIDHFDENEDLPALLLRC